MAQAHAHPAYQQGNKGTLAPGQPITVNKYNVQVERYLSQGGFAHVYLVRTATPVYNTTRHVLKRIAVPNEAMLSEVKKEVDIMRLLKGHPNIVHLIDAAWHRMHDGTFEVFILMEFCAGGGIIDMMNRRLRERLTESEILQIFVDVCEGVASMHASRPPLLHRDLKVENILQASETSYKLCDFGSATTVAPRPPATTQEIRILEADLNRHTTLQYRAPEMVDPYLRRPVDEKSDVWALGVLLYKLCYYTTPFEEHGPLAILNVQYRIPPYPVYSSQLNSLIASMLREHGAHRPNVFELLTIVHSMRGTKSKFQYNVPSPSTISPRQASQSKHLAKSPPVNPAETTISYRSAQQIAANSRIAVMNDPISVDKPIPKNNGVAAREKVLEAMAPMRRGRPSATASSPSTPARELNVQLGSANRVSADLLGGFDAEEDTAWKSATNKGGQAPSANDDAWNVGSPAVAPNAKPSAQGFGDDFAEKLWDSFDQNAVSQKPNPSTTAVKSTVVPARSPGVGSEYTRYKPSTTGRSKDAFDGLGLATGGDKAAPTLGEARKLRTGLAAMGGSQSNNFNRPDGSAGLVPASLPPSRLTPSPRLSYAQPKVSNQPSSAALSPSPQPAPTWQRAPSPRPGSSTQPEGSAESRFPSLEELDASFSPGTTAKPPPHASSQPSLASHDMRKNSPKPTGDGMIGSSSRILLQPRASHLKDGVRSQQVTGTAMLEGNSRKDGTAVRRDEKIKTSEGSKRLDNSMLTSRPTLVRKHRSSVMIKHATPAQPELPPPQSPAENPNPSLAVPVRPPMDWLTGDDDEQVSPPVVRDSPSKRASFIEGGAIPLGHAISVQPEHMTLPIVTSSPAVTPPPSLSSRSERPAQTANFPTPAPTQPKIGKTESQSSADEGPEEATASLQRRKTHTSHGSTRIKHKGRQSSVHDLVDMWSGSPNANVQEKTGNARNGKSANEDADVTPKAMKLRSTNTPSSQPFPSSQSYNLPQGDYLAFPTSQSRSQQDSSPQRELSATRSTPSPSRSRPQSMFAFPSQTFTSEPREISDSSSKALVPPIARERSTRRTSITDMVQRYEAIGSIPKPKPMHGSLSKPNASPITTSTSEHAGSRIISRREGFGIPLPGLDTRSAGENADTRRSPTRPSQLPPRRDFGRDTPSAPSPKPLMVKTSVSADAHLAPSPSPRTPVFPTRKPTADSLKPSSSSEEARSPSPDRPYQGVGKLIDQWQRKAASNDSTPSSTSSRRGGFSQKRTGVVGSRGT